jgi:hypothetical protein
VVHINQGHTYGGCVFQAECFCQNYLIDLGSTIIDIQMEDITIVWIDLNLYFSSVSIG